MNMQEKECARSGENGETKTLREDKSANRKRWAERKKERKKERKR